MDWLAGISENLGMKPELGTAARLAFSLVLGGLIALYMKALYNRLSASTSSSELVGNVFPLLTLVTICVISVVKSSLALSLGLVGALSIVRFRAAIKDPEELVYLFWCIAIGLAFGADQILFGVILVLVASAFLLGGHLLGRGARRHNLMLTVTGDAGRYFDDPETGALVSVRDLTGSFTIQRYEVEDDRGVMRVAVAKMTSEETASLISGLRKRLPGCHISYVNMDSVL